MNSPNTEELHRQIVELRGDLTKLRTELQALRQRVAAALAIPEEKDEPHRNDPSLP